MRWKFVTTGRTRTDRPNVSNCGEVMEWMSEQYRKTSS